jgi:hypothetical protein
MSIFRPTMCRPGQCSVSNTWCTNTIYGGSSIWHVHLACILVQIYDPVQSERAYCHHGCAGYIMRSTDMPRGRPYTGLRKHACNLNSKFGSIAGPCCSCAVKLQIDDFARASPTNRRPLMAEAAIIHQSMSL